jgi:hypothetical protein
MTNINDKLDQMFARQLDAQESTHGYHFESMSDEEKLDYIRFNVLAVEDELHEALGETGWKPWATSNHINREAYIGELVDAFHFLMNLGLVVDLTADEFFARYLAKRQRNDERQAEGYDGVSGKCRLCGRGLDDPGVICTAKRCELER